MMSMSEHHGGSRSIPESNISLCLKLRTKAIHNPTSIMICRVMRQKPNYFGGILDIYVMYERKGYQLPT